MAQNVLISDFDGTVTENDFFALVQEQYLPADAPDYLGQWRRGALSHFEAISKYFAHTPTDEAALADLLERTRPDAQLPALSSHLEQSGWDLIIVSAGCHWYIDRILAQANVKATVHSNPGRIEQGRGLVLDLPRQSPFFCPKVGVDKEAVVRDALGRYDRVAYAGDSRLDLAPALLVQPEYRFAKAFLASELDRLGQGFRPFQKWSEVVFALTC